jgi:hypothetical protein
VPCQQHMTNSSPSEDSDDASPVELAPVNAGTGPEANLEEERRDRTTNKAAGRIREYSSLLKNPTDAGDYHWNGVTLSKSEIERRIERMGTFQ